MNIDPFVSVDDMPFSASMDHVLQARGTPAATCRNGVGLNELDYGDAIYRFQDCGRLEEMTMRAPMVHIGGIEMAFGELAAFVRDRDPSAFEKADFVISPRFGLAFAPDCPPWVTALARHCLEAWRAI
ncbi:hypothetical protein ACIPRI_24130 [Variovorax sp. LARHSF232]